MVERVRECLESAALDDFGTVGLRIEEDGASDWIVLEAGELRSGPPPDGAIRVEVEARTLNRMLDEGGVDLSDLCGARLVVTGATPGVLAMLGCDREAPGPHPAEQRAGFVSWHELSGCRGTAAIDESRGYPPSLTSELLDQVLLVAVILAGLDNDVRELHLDRLFDLHVGHRLPGHALPRLAVSLTDLASDSSEHELRQREILGERVAQAAEAARL